MKAVAIFGIGAWRDLHTEYGYIFDGRSEAAVVNPFDTLKITNSRIRYR